MTKQAFLREYRATLLRYYDWAKEEARLDRFMAGVEAVLSGEATYKAWEASGPALSEAWKAIGGKGRVTRKALRALPEGDEK